MAEVSIIPWRWRDGTIHLEVRTQSFADEDGTIRTHVQVDGKYAFGETLCGASYTRGVHASGLAGAQGVDCEECRTLLASLTFKCSVMESTNDPHSRKVG